MSTILSSKFLSPEEISEFQNLLLTQDGFSRILEKLIARGGAMLDFFAEGTLPGIEAMKRDMSA